MVEYKDGQTSVLMAVLIQGLEEVMFLQFDSKLMVTFASCVAKHVNKAPFLKAVQTTAFQKQQEFSRNTLRLYASSVVKRLFHKNYFFCA